MEPRPGRRGLPHAAGLIAVAVALVIAIPLAASIATSGVKDIKQARNTLVVTGSARYPISANLATWILRASAQQPTPSQAIKALRVKVAQVDSFLTRGGISADGVTKPPIQVAQVFVNVPTGLKKPAFRRVPAWHVSQTFSIETTQIDTLVRTASQVGNLLAGGTDVSVSTIEYLSTKLTNAKFAALRLAVADARKRATTIAEGLDARLGPVQKTTLGVFNATQTLSAAVDL